MSLEKAIKIACVAHEGQLDKGGRPYILHPLRLMMKFTVLDYQITAILHDSVEDSDLSLKDLKNYGFSDEVIKAVDCLTKRKGEIYKEFIKRISLNRISTIVKIEDIKDNLDVTRLTSIEEKDLKRLKKYHESLDFLKSVSLTKKK